jgi:HSP20 family protein
MSNLIKFGSVPVGLLDFFDSFRDDFWKSPEFQLQRNWRPTDIVETETEYIVEIELPRFRREDIKVEVTKDVLKVTAKNSRSNFIREFSLAYVEFDRADVKLEDGVLKITVPKSENGKTKYLDIK